MKIAVDMNAIEQHEQEIVKQQESYLNRQRTAATNFEIEQDRQRKKIDKLRRRLEETTDPGKRARVEKRLRKLLRGGRA